MSNAVCEAPAATSAVDLQLLKTEIDEYGYVVVPNLIPTDRCERMTARLMEVMRQRPEAQALSQNYNGFFNILESADYELFVPLLDNPVVLAMAEYMVGRNFQISATGSLWVKPGAPAGGWHADSPLHWFPQNGKSMPNCCLCMNVLWMLTDFTVENGATQVLPFSHHSLRHPRSNVTYRNPAIAEGRAGSCLIFHGALWHQAGPNISRDTQRMGVSNPYFPSFVDGGNCGWPPIKRQVFDRLPAHVQRMHKHIVD